MFVIPQIIYHIFNSFINYKNNIFQVLAYLIVLFRLFYLMKIYSFIPILPYIISQLRDQWMIYFCDWCVNVSIEIFVEKNINLINQQNFR